MTSTRHGLIRHRSGRVVDGQQAAEAGRDPQVPARLVTVTGVPLIASIGLVILANVLALGDLRLIFIGPAAGFWFLVVQPCYLLYTTSIWRGSGALERAGYSVTAVLLILMLGGLAINAVLPVLGVARPLDAAPVVVLGDLVTAGAFMLRQRRPAKLVWRGCLRALTPLDARLITGAALCLPLAILGANRINNSAGDQLSLAALACMIVTLIVTVLAHRRLTDQVIGCVIYLVSVSLLLMNSLRGWYLTGHDIQTEYRMFQLTAGHGRWSMAYTHIAYNACLSITILPTEISRVVNVYDPYVYKFFFQLLFAVCPVLVYAIARRFAPKSVALLATIYFIGFPTFFGDMPYLNRQEIAFLFVCVALLSVTNSRWPQSQRRFGLYIAAVGVELSHYSTMYQFIGMIAVGWLAGSVFRLSSRLTRRWRRSASAPSWPVVSRTVGLGSVLIVGAILPLWGGLATQTAGPVLTDAETAISQLVGHSSIATPYSLLSQTPPNAQRLLEGYRHTALQQSALLAGSFYLPTATVERYPTPLANEPVLPLTRLGRLLSDIGIPVQTLNNDVRQGSAKDEQLFVIAGFVALLFVRQLRRRVSQELLLLGAGLIFMVGIFTIFPNLSVDYGVLRAFQTALIVAAPILVAGSIALLSPFGRKWAIRLAAVICLGIFISTIGFMPQLTGGYPPQLGLNNSGQYYDDFYTHAQEVAAVNWLAGKPGVLPAGLQTPLGENTADRFAFSTPADVDGKQFVSDIYPVLIQRRSWVLLSYSIVTADRAPISINGTLISYKYPIAMLQNNKNLVYDNGGAEIYK
jgi:uncharacterized membrane protein